MVRTKKISAKEIPDLVRLSYEGDAELWQSQHAKPLENIDEAVDLTCFQIEQMAAEKKMNYYKVIWQKQDVGYYITFENFLFSFAINKEFRNKEVLIGWWNWVKASLKKNFLCILYPHQHRALSFLQRNGMGIAEYDKANNAIILIHN